MRKVLLSFCSLAERWLPTLDEDDGHYSLGLGYLAAVLEQAGHDCLILFAPGLPRSQCLEQLQQTITSYRPDVVGFGIISDNRVASYRAIEWLHASQPDIPILIGGIHTTVMYRQLLERYPFLIAVLGEGERTVPELIATLATNGDLASVAGIAFVNNGAVVTTANRPLIDPLDELPFPRHEAFFTPQRTAAQIITSRGCPFRCSFCVLDVVSHRQVRYRSVTHVVDEIEFVLQRFPQVTSFQILDDQFFLNKRRVIHFCDEVVRRNIRTDFIVQGRVKPFDRDVVLAMERAHFYHVTLGLESGARQILKSCHKGIVPEDVQRAVSLLAGTKLGLTVLLIIGLPGETRETILETIALCKDLQKRHYHYYSHQIQTIFVYPGSELHDLAKQAGMITDDFWLTDQDVPYYTVEHSLEEMQTDYRELLLNHLCAERIFLPEGFAAQKEMIPYINRQAFTNPRPGKEYFRHLVLHVVQRMGQQGQLEIKLKVSQSLLAEMRSGIIFTEVVRDTGSDHQFTLTITPIDNSRIIEKAIEQAYQHGPSILTQRIDEGVAEFLAEALALDNPWTLLGQIPGIERINRHPVGYKIGRQSS
ncbi:MAG: B12-binding domain-containing radical SAM protein [Magnetococcales bacterium]|nr:B12-binding domain-containing radical SAM protein [Magnetococcales bacterium]